MHTHNSKAGFIGRLVARINRVPIVIHTVHGFAFHDEESWLRRHLFAFLERTEARWCDQMIACSQPMIEWAQEHEIAPREKFVKIYSGIEIEEFRNQPSDPQLKRRFGIEPGETVIGIVSKLWKGKGHAVLIESVNCLLARGYSIKLLIVGEGSLERELKDKVKQLGIEQAVVFTGFWGNVPEVTAILDISVLPSFYEGMGRVVLEAMAAGKPVVASSVGGLTELVKDQVTGYLVPAGDVGALMERLETLIRDPDLRQKMGAEGSRQMRHEYSADAMVKMIHEVYLRYLTAPMLLANRLG